MPLTRWVLFGLATLGMGCAADQNSSAPGGPTASWVADRGGPSTETYQSRAQRAASALICHCQGRPVVVMVLATDNPAAFSWRDGHVYLTSGLMDRMNDADLAAVVAHELGHLIDNGIVRPPYSLGGAGEGVTGDGDIEVRADALGVKMLEACGMKPQAMLEMLVKFKDFGSLSPATEATVGKRIAVLKERLGKPVLD